MSGIDEFSSDEERDFEDDEEYYDEESSEEEEALLADDRLFSAIWLAHTDADAGTAAVRQAVRAGANVNAIRNDMTPLLEACICGYDQIVGILLDAGADERWKDDMGYSAITEACFSGRLSIVQRLINHDNGLLEFGDSGGQTLLTVAIKRQHPDIVRFLLDSGVDARYVFQSGDTALMHACLYDNGSLEIVRLLLAAGADLEACDRSQQTVLHRAAIRGRSDIMLGLILQHNANMFAVDRYGRTPFDTACCSHRRITAIDRVLEIYGNKLTHDHGRLALHELLKDAEYSVAEDEEFHPPLMDTSQIILPLGKLTSNRLRTLLRTLDPELVRERDDTGKLPLHIACRTNAPVEVLALILELDPTTLHIADSTGALPIHLLCGTTRSTEYASVRYLVEQGGVGTLAARNRQGLLPLHVLCESRNPPLRSVQYLIESFPGSVAMPTNDGQYPFMMAAAADSSLASLSVIYELVRVNPGLVNPR